MPTASITSAKTGQTFDVDFEQAPTAEDIDEVTSAWETQFYQREGLDPAIAEQGPVGTVMNQVRNVGPGLVGGLMQQGGRVLDAAAEGVARLTGTQRGGLFADVADVGGRLIEAGQELRPTNPANAIANTIGGGLQQAAGLVATMGAAAPLMGTKAALTTVPLVQAGIMGGGEGVQTARDLGIDNPAGQLATGAAFAGAEILTEKLGGVGNKAATEALQAGLKTGLKQAGKTALGEGLIEEPLSGLAQDVITRVAALPVADPNRPGFTETGFQLPTLDLTDPAFWEKRKMEAIGGLAGGAVFGGLQLAASGQAGSRGQEVKATQAAEVPVSEDLGDLTAEDVADLEAEDSETGRPADSGRLKPILTNVPDRAPAGVGQTVSEAPTRRQPILTNVQDAVQKPTLTPTESAPADQTVPNAIEGVTATPTQTITGSNVQMGTEMPVPPPTADAGAGAGDMVAEVSQPVTPEASVTPGTESATADKTGEQAIGAGSSPAAGTVKPQKFQGVLWGKKASMGDVWLKLTDDVSDAEMKRRQKEGWQVERLSKGQHPDDYKTNARVPSSAETPGLAGIPPGGVAAGSKGFQNTQIEQDLQAGFMSTAAVDALFDLAGAAMKAGKNFAQWTAEMVKRFGEAIQSALRAVWEGVLRLNATDAVKNARLGGKAKNAPVKLKHGGFVMGPNKVEETKARFARPDEQERLYEVRADVVVKATAQAWVDSMPMEQAVAAMEAGRLPASMTGDVAQHAAGLLIQRTTEMMKSGSEVVQMQARSLGHRISKVWQGWLSQEAGRNLRQRSVVNSELTPYAPILAAEGMLIDRADAVMDKRYEGGATGGATKVNETAAEAGDEAGESLADDLEGDTPERKAAKKQVRKQMAPAKKKLSKAQRTAERILKQLSEVYADPPIWKQKGQPDPVRALYMKHVKQPMLEADFVNAMKALGVPDGLAGTLWEASRLEIEARETLRLMAEAERAAAKDARQIEVAENKASRLIYRTEERLRQGSKDLSRSTDGDSINKVFRDKVKDDIGWETFRDRLAKLRVGEEIASRLWRTAERERMDQAAMVRFREQRKADAVKQGILATGSTKLRKMLNDLRQKIAPDMTWADIFMELPASQKERQREIYRRLMLDERLKGLSKDERLALTNELDKAWQQERRKVFLRELERVGIGEKSAADKAKVVKALPKLIRLINLGMMNSEMFREAIAPEYGLKQITTGQALSLRKLAEEAYALPEGVLRSRKLAELLDGIQKSTGASLPEVLNQYWVAAVLSGLRTQFDTFMSVTNGFGNQLIQSGMLALKNGNRAAAMVSMLEWWRGLKQAFPEAMQILSKGDYSYLKRFNADLKKALEGESTFRPVPLGEALWRDGNAVEKYGFAPIMIFTGRLMAAADHLNNSATTAGAKVVARALHPELYKTTAPSQAERDAAAAQARREVTGGAMPATAEERATVAARTREILNGQMRPEEVAEASFMGDQAAYQNDPVGVFGGIYRAVNQGLGTLERGLQTYAEQRGADGPAGQYARGLMLFLSGAMRSMMGAKFIRFGANFGNDMLGYVPGTALISPALLGTEATRSQRQLLMGKNVFGLMAGLTVAAMFLGKDDEEDGWHLEGPWTDLTPEEIKQRRAAGFEPLTFWKRDDGKLNRVSYKQWPTAGLLAGVAHMQDRQRFRPDKWAAEGMAGHLLAAASVGAFQVKNVSAMQGLAQLLGASKLGSNPEEAWLETMAKMPINFAGGFIPTLAKDLDALADPQRYKPESVLEEFLRNVPVVRQRVAGGRPEINILGVPIEQDRKPWSRAYTEAENSLAHQRLAKLIGRGFNLPTPQTNRKVWKAGTWTTIAALGADAEWRYQKKVGDGYREWLSSAEAADLLTNPDGLAVQRVINRQADAIKMRAVQAVVK